MHAPWYIGLRESPFWGAVLVAISLPVAFWVTYESGGSSTAFPHLFYIPVIVAAFFYHRWGGLLVGVMAGILCGPFMPSFTDLGTAQTVDNWLLRLTFFVAIGLLTGGLSQRLYNRLIALRTLNAETIKAFVKAIDAKDPYTANHSVRVAQYAVAICQALGLSHPDTERVKWVALLHDVGKIAVPGEILRKAGSLSSEERALIEGHPIRAVEIVGEIPSYREYLPGIRQHHERVDGRGYPEGVSGDAICRDARIIAVADAYEAMTSDRPYRAALEPGEALVRLQQAAGTQFDPTVVEALARALSQTPQPPPSNRRRRKNNRLSKQRPSKNL